MVRIVLLLAGYWAMQVGAAYFIKFGSTAPQRALPGFVIGNVLAVASTWLLILLYQRMPRDVNVALGLAVGGAFMFAQVALAVIFRSSLSAVQMIGVAAILGGMLCLCLKGAA